MKKKTKKSKTPDNRKITGIPKPRPTAFKPGKSGNPNGAPKRGTSWSEVIKTVSEMTPAQIIEALKGGIFADQLRKMPQHMSMKYLVVIRWFIAQMNEPSPSLAGVIMDREDGKVAGDTGGATTIVYVGRDSAWRPTGVIEMDEPKQIEQGNGKAR